MLAGKALLIVDDDLAIRTLYEKVLSKAGWNVRLAEDGNVAIEMMETRQADLILVDMLMPRKDGVGTMMALKERWPASIIVAMSGGGWIDAEGCLKLAKFAGAHGVIRKPMPIQDLVRTLSSLLDEGLKVQAA